MRLFACLAVSCVLSLLHATNGENDGLESLLSETNYWEERTAAHNNMFDPLSLSSSGDYKGGSYLGESLHSLVVKSLNLSQHFLRLLPLNQTQLFTPLANRLIEKCIFKHNQHNPRTCKLNIAIFGGSVTYGSACRSDNDDSDPRFCAWPHRFVHFATQALQTLLLSLSSVTAGGEGVDRKATAETREPISPYSFNFSISPRYCAVGGRDSAFGLNLLKSRLYKRCFMNITAQVSEEYDASWEPDLVVWDYATNDQVAAEDAFQDMYELFISYATDLLPSRPQVLAVEFVGSSAKNLQYYPPLLQHRIQKRKKINIKYHIPAIDYPGLFAGYWTPRSTLYMAADVSPHPQWPTHFVWAHLLTSYILFSLSQLKLNGRAALLPVPWKTQSPTPKFSSLFCPSGYNSFLDFSFSKYKLPRNVRITHSKEWSFNSDSATKAMRRPGYLYSGNTPMRPDLGSKLQQGSAAKKKNSIVSKRTSSAYNFIQISCSASSSPVKHGGDIFALSGMVSVGYMESYGTEWAHAVVTIKYHCSSTADEISIDTHRNKTFIVKSDSFTLVSNTNRNISVLKEFQHIYGKKKTLATVMESSLTSSVASSEASSTTKGVCPEGSSWLSKVDISFHVKKHTGTKFKLLSLGFC